MRERRRREGGWKEWEREGGETGRGDSGRGEGDRGWRERGRERERTEREGGWRGREGEGGREGGGGEGRGRNMYIPIYSANLIPYIWYTSHSSIWVHVTGVSTLPPGLHKTSPEGALPASWKGPERAPPVHCSAA